MAHDQMVKKMATEKLDANNDLVKMLTSLGARAAAFTIRDKQASFDRLFDLFRPKANGCNLGTFASTDIATVKSSQPSACLRRRGAEAGVVFSSCQHVVGENNLNCRFLSHLLSAPFSVSGV